MKANNKIFFLLLMVFLSPFSIEAHQLQKLKWKRYKNPANLNGYTHIPKKIDKRPELVVLLHGYQIQAFVLPEKFINSFKKMIRP